MRKMIGMLPADNLSLIYLEGAEGFGWQAHTVPLIGIAAYELEDGQAEYRAICLDEGSLTEFTTKFHFRAICRTPEAEALAETMLNELYEAIGE